MTDHLQVLQASALVAKEAVEGFAPQTLQKPFTPAQTTSTNQGTSTQDVAELVDTLPNQTLTEQEEKKVSEAVSQVNDIINPLSISLNVVHIESLNRFHVEVVNTETNEVIREVPPKKIIEMEQRMRALQGLLFDEII